MILMYVAFWDEELVSFQDDICECFIAFVCISGGWEFVDVIFYVGGEIGPVCFLVVGEGGVCCVAIELGFEVYGREDW